MASQSNWLTQGKMLLQGISDPILPQTTTMPYPSKETLEEDRQLDNNEKAVSH